MQLFERGRNVVKRLNACQDVIMIRQHRPCGNFRFDLLKREQQPPLKLRASFGRFHHARMFIICGSQHVISLVAKRVRRRMKRIAHRLSLREEFLLLFGSEFAILVRHIFFVVAASVAAHNLVKQTTEVVTTVVTTVVNTVVITKP